MTPILEETSDILIIAWNYAFKWYFICKSPFQILTKMSRTSVSLLSFYLGNGKNTITEKTFQKNSERKNRIVYWLPLLTFVMVSIQLLWILDTSLFIICNNLLLWFDVKSIIREMHKVCWADSIWLSFLGKFHRQILMVLSFRTYQWASLFFCATFLSYVIRFFF